MPWSIHISILEEKSDCRWLKNMLMDPIAVRLREHQLSVLQHRLEHQKSRPCHGCWGSLRVHPPEPETIRGHKAPPEMLRDFVVLLSGSRVLPRGCRVPRIFFQLKIFPVFYVNHLVTNIFIPTNRAFYGVYIWSYSMKLTKCLLWNCCSHLRK